MDDQNVLCWGLVIILIVVLLIVALLKRGVQSSNTLTNNTPTETSLQFFNFIKISNEIRSTSSKLLTYGPRSFNELNFHTINYAIVGINTEQSKIYFLLPGFSSQKLVDFSEILRCETLQDTHIIASAGVGRAIVGGLIAGGVGAIVGAATRPYNNVVSDMRINITTTNIKDPLIILHLVKSQIGRNSEDYHMASKFAQELQATMESIIYQNQTNNARIDNVGAANVDTAKERDIPYTEEYNDLPEL